MFPKRSSEDGAKLWYHRTNGCCPGKDRFIGMGTAMRMEVEDGILLLQAQECQGSVENARYWVSSGNILP